MLGRKASGTDFDGSSSVGRAPVSKTGCREFEPLLPCKKDYSMPRHWIIFFYIFYFLKEFAKVYEVGSSTATQDVARCKQSLLPYKHKNKDAKNNDEQTNPNKQKDPPQNKPLYPHQYDLD